MKKKFFPMAAAVAILGFTACNNDSSTTSTDDSSTTTTRTSSESDNEGGSSTASTGGSASFDENASYVDLSTGKSVKLKRDASTGNITSQEDNSIIRWYFNPVTNDTFNESGQVVNNYLIRGVDGSYSLDEARWKTKVDEDGDFKAKDGEESKVKVDGTEPESKVKTEGAKEKVDENSYKLKTKEGTLKVKEDGRVKVRDNN